MPIELRVPTVGESVTEVQIGQWLKKEGDWVEQDEAVCELDTEKASVEVFAPKAGVLTSISKRSGEFANVGDAIGLVDETAAKPNKTTSSNDGALQPGASASAAPSPTSGSIAAPPASRPAAAQTKVASPTAPTAPAMTTAASPPSPAPGAPPVVRRPAQSPMAAPSVGGMLAVPRDEEEVPMTLVRRKIAERLVSAQQNAALLTTFNEIDMSSVMAARKKYGESFQSRYGVKLGFMSFFVKAAIDALRLIPQLNAEVRGHDIVYRNYFDIGIAVGGGKGLVVPIIRNAERLNFAEIEISISDLAKKAKDNDLRVEDLQGGTFTISNGGIYGSLLSTPIVNPPQSGVLGLHAIQDRAVVIDGQIVVRPMMYVALTYDHRIVDGREAVTWLKRVKENIEDPSRMLLEV